MDQHAEGRRKVRELHRGELARYQLQRLEALRKEILPKNAFYAGKLKVVEFPLQSLDDLRELPLTLKEELQEAATSTLSSRNQTYPLAEYVRFHQTSGTRGRPLVVLDTAGDWQWWLDTWQYVLDAAGLTAEDRVMMAFSFGPFIGFWSAHDAVEQRGCLILPGGGLSSLGRLELLKNGEATAVCCTPSYALHLADVARENDIDLAGTAVRVLILAGEPGGSVPAIRGRIEQAWGAKVCDHSGATEIGPWGFPDSDGTGLFVNEAEFIPEFLSVESGQPAGEGELSQLVLTNLGRCGYPVIRYRAGDLVRPSWQSRSGCNFVFLEGGVLGRADDMMIIRGVNVYPSAVEEILRTFPEIVEYRLIATRRGEMDQLEIELEDALEQPGRVAEELRTRLNLRVEVRCVAAGSLPRFELKGKRFVDRR